MAGGAAGAWGERQAGAVPRSSNTGANGRSVRSLKSPTSSPRSPVGLEEEEGRENPVLRGSCLWGGCWLQVFGEWCADFHTQIVKIFFFLNLFSLGALL